MRLNGCPPQDAALAASPVGPIIAAVNATFPSHGIALDAAALPNPFYGVAPDTFIDSNQTLLALVDGGDDGEVSPLQPMLVKSRGVDVLFVIDAVSQISRLHMYASLANCYTSGGGYGRQLQ